MVTTGLKREVWSQQDLRGRCGQNRTEEGGVVTTGLKREVWLQQDLRGRCGYIGVVLFVVVPYRGP